VEAIREAYDAGERDFGESRVQELLEKQKVLPKDIRWHFIGHLQTNKVKQIVPFIHLIHSVDSLRLMEAINREAEKAGRIVDVLLELHLGAEETKQGFTENEILYLCHSERSEESVRIRGLMGMATNTDDFRVIEKDFARIEALYNKVTRYPLFCVPGMALILLVKVQSRVFTAKCSEPQAVRSNPMGEGRGVAKSSSLRTET